MKHTHILQKALESLKWFVENDDTNIGQEGNEFWESGLNKGISAISMMESLIRDMESPQPPTAQPAVPPMPEFDCYDTDEFEHGQLTRCTHGLWVRLSDVATAWPK